jgi:hypothetical protein
MQAAKPVYADCVGPECGRGARLFAHQIDKARSAGAQGPS